MAKIQTACLSIGCKRDTATGRRGFCWKHYKEFRLQNRDAIKVYAPDGAPLAWLEANVAATGTDCLIWPFARDVDGYGRVEWDGRTQVASRVMCTLAHGKPPSPTSETLHRCGQGSAGCVHPDHLRWGTSAENSADAIEHGTMAWGERGGRAVLTAEQVKEIRALCGHESHRAIAKRFGVSHSCVGMIHRRVNWSRLSEG